MEEIVTETIKLILEQNSTDTEFEAFLDRYKQDYNLYKLTDYKFLNGKLQREAQAGVFEEPLRPIRNVGTYKIFAERVECSVSYTRYYIADTKSGDVYTFESSHIDGWNGTLNKLVTDLTLVINNEYKESIKPKKYDFDISAGI